MKLYAKKYPQKSVWSDLLMEPIQVLFERFKDPRVGSPEVQIRRAGSVTLMYQ